MPIYEYACATCNQRYELFESVEEMVRTKDSKFCQMCEGRLQKLISVPNLRTDTQFQQGIHFRDGFRNDRDRRKAHALARKMGVNINGKRYDGRLARFPCDPLACYGDRGEARSAARRMGVGSPDLGVAPPPDLDTGKPYRVAEDIVERHAKEKVLTEHGGSVPRKKWNKIKDEIRERISPPAGTEL